MTTPVAASPVPAIDRAALEQRVADLSLYSESGDAVSDGEIWYVPETADVFGPDGFSFQDLLDVINPLHHLPVIGSLYRAITDDEIAPAPRMAGGALFGGVIGFVAGLVNAVIEDETGSDLGEKALALIGIGGDTTAVAQKSAGPTETAPASSQPSAPISGKPAIETAALAVAPGTGAPRPTDAAAPVSARQSGAPGGTGTPIVSASAAARLAQETPARAAATAGIAGFPLTQGTPPTAAQPDAPNPIGAKRDAKSATATRLNLTHHGNERLAAQTAPAAAVPKLMREALDKYDVLMRKRQPPTVSGDF